MALGLDEVYVETVEERGSKGFRVVLTLVDTETDRVEHIERVFEHNADRDLTGTRCRELAHLVEGLNLLTPQEQRLVQIHEGEGPESHAGEAEPPELQQPPGRPEGGVLPPVPEPPVQPQGPDPTTQAPLPPTGVPADEGE